MTTVQESPPLRKMVNSPNIQSRFRTLSPIKTFLIRDPSLVRSNQVSNNPASAIMKEDFLKQTLSIFKSMQETPVPRQRMLIKSPTKASIGTVGGRRFSDNNRHSSSESDDDSLSPKSHSIWDDNLLSLNGIFSLDSLSMFSIYKLRGESDPNSLKNFVKLFNASKEYRTRKNKTKSKAPLLLEGFERDKCPMISNDIRGSKNFKRFQEYLEAFTFSESKKQRPHKYMRYKRKELFNLGINRVKRNFLEQTDETEIRERSIPKSITSATSHLRTSPSELLLSKANSSGCSNHCTNNGGGDDEKKDQRSVGAFSSEIPKNIKFKSMILDSHSPTRPFQALKVEQNLPLPCLFTATPNRNDLRIQIQSGRGVSIDKISPNLSIKQFHLRTNQPMSLCNLDTIDNSETTTFNSLNPFDSPEKKINQRHSFLQDCFQFSQSHLLIEDTPSQNETILLIKEDLNQQNGLRIHQQHQLNESQLLLNSSQLLLNSSQLLLNSSRNKTQSNNPPQKVQKNTFFHQSLKSLSVKSQQTNSGINFLPKIIDRQTSFKKDGLICSIQQSTAFADKQRIIPSSIIKQQFN